MTENEAIKIFNDLLDVPCEMLIEYDSVINSEKKQALVRLRTAEEIAINALEKQVPKKIVRVKLRPTEWGSGFRCPECEAEQTATEFFGYGKADNKITFCGSCGQKLDWSDED